MNGIMSLFGTLSLLLIQGNAIAAPYTVMNLYGDREIVDQVNRYLSGGPEHHGCRGNNLSSGVEKLEIVADEDENGRNYYLVADVWANSWHRFKVKKDCRWTQRAIQLCGLQMPENDKLTAYGGPHRETDTNARDEQLRECGLVAVGFKLPIYKNLETGEWVMGTGTNEKLIARKDFLSPYLNYALKPLFPQHPAGPGRVEISGKKIFQIVKPYLTRLE